MEMSTGNELSSFPVSRKQEAGSGKGQGRFASWKGQAGRALREPEGASGKREENAVSRKGQAGRENELAERGEVKSGKMGPWNFRALGMLE